MIQENNSRRKMLTVMLIQIIVKLTKAKITEQVLESRKRKIKHSRQGNNDLVNIWLPWCSDGKESSCNAGDPGSIPGSGRSPGGGRGNPLQYSCPENPWTEGPGGLQSVGSQRVGHSWAADHKHSAGTLRSPARAESHPKEKKCQWEF